MQQMNGNSWHSSMKYVVDVPLRDIKKIYREYSYTEHAYADHIRPRQQILTGISSITLRFPDNVHCPWTTNNAPSGLHKHDQWKFSSVMD